MSEYTIGVCATCGGVSHLDKPCLTHPGHTAQRRIVKVCDVAERDRLREALDEIYDGVTVNVENAVLVQQIAGAVLNRTGGDDA